MNVAQATFPAFGIDTVQRLKVSDCQYLMDRNYSFVVRYLGGLDKAELATILDSGLALMPVVYSRKPGWTPTEVMGTDDGKHALTRIGLLGLPVGCTVWLDLEGCAGSPVDTASWVNAWAKVVQDAGYEAGLYVGAQPGGLDAEDLYDLKVTRYWRSCSRVPEPAKCGFCMFQLYPPNLKLDSLLVDIDVISKDFRDRLPHWVVA